MTMKLINRNSIYGVIFATYSAFMLTANAQTVKETNFGVATPSDIGQGAYNSYTSTTFNFAQPASIERCRMTKELEATLNNLPKDDIQTLTQAKQFLVSCQKLLSNRNTTAPYIADNIAQANRY